MSILSYINSKIDNWKLINEVKVINSLSCKKATVSFKGRDWVAWYSTEIPFPYGPFKFGGLPGLIVKITDAKDDYDFELVKSTPSSALIGKLVSIDKSHYENSKFILLKAKENFENNITEVLESMGTKIINEGDKQNLLEKQKRDAADKKEYNPLELED